MLGLHGLDWAILIIYISIVAYLGLFLGARKTRTLGDFFIAGGTWGKLPAFLFNFSSALAGAEAVVVSAAAYRSGLSGIWLWWSQLLATPMYYLFSALVHESELARNEPDSQVHHLPRAYDDGLPSSAIRLRM